MLHYGKFATSSKLILLKKGGAIISTFFKRIFFRQNKFETVGETRKALRGSGGMPPRKNFENLDAANGFFSVF